MDDELSVELGLGSNRELMLEIEELAELEGFRNFAKLGTEFSVPSEVILKLDNKAEKQAVDAADEILQNAIDEVESDLSTLDGVAVKHSLAGAVSDFLVGAGSSTFTFVRKTLAEVKSILGLGSAAYTASSDYAVSNKGVTNGDSHDHAGGDGSQVDHGGLGGNADDDHSQYLLAGGSRVLSADWDIGNGRMIQTDKIRARDADGLALYDDGGNGIFVKDGGDVGVGTINPDTYAGYTSLEVNNPASGGLIIVGSGANKAYWQHGGVNGILYSEVGTPAAIRFKAGIVTSATDEHIRLTTSGNLGVNTGTASAKFAINGGVHVGGDSDPGDNNLLVDGVSSVVGVATFNDVVVNHTITASEGTIPVLRAPSTKKIVAIEGVKISEGTRGAFVDLVTGTKNWWGITSIGNDLYAAVSGGSIWKSTNSGVTWVDLVAGNKQWYGITSIGNDLYATVGGGSIWKSTDSGVTWVDLVAGNKNWLGITSIGSDLYATVYAGSIWKSTDSGVTWVDLVAGNKNWQGITSIGSDLYATVSGGSIWKSTSGVTWVDLVAGNKRWVGITSIGNDLYAVVELDGSMLDGSIWKSTNSGVTWVDLVAGNKQWAGIVSIGNDLYVTVYSGSIWKSKYTGNMQVDGTLKIVGNSGFYNTAPVAQPTGIAALKINYTTGDLDTEAEIISAINTTNTAINALRTALNALGLTTTV